MNALDESQHHRLGHRSRFWLGDIKCVIQLYHRPIHQLTRPSGHLTYLAFEACPTLLYPCRPHIRLKFVQSEQTHVVKRLSCDMFHRGLTNNNRLTLRAIVSPLKAHISTCSGVSVDTTFAASTKGSLTRLTVNSLVAIIFARVSSGFCDVTENEMLRSGGLCATLEMDDYVT